MKITKHNGKGSQQQVLPNKGALHDLIASPQRTINDYAKRAPAVTTSTPNIVDMGADE